MNEPNYEATDSEPYDDDDAAELCEFSLLLFGGGSWISHMHNSRKT